jgi:hypothetical protein
MVVNFYKCGDAPNVAHKTLTGAITRTNVHPVHPCNLLQPVLEIDRDTTLYNYNYAYILDFEKYYFMSPPTLTTGGKMIIQLSVDVLTTFINDVSNCDAIVLRNENAPTLVPDSQLPIDVNQYFVQGIDFASTPFTNIPQSESDKPYILITR